MKLQLTNEICNLMCEHLSSEQNEILEKTLIQVFSNFSLPSASAGLMPEDCQQNIQLINLFVAAKRIEGCSEKTIKYYANTLTKRTSLQADHCRR